MDEAVARLLKRGWLTPADVVNHGIVVDDRSRRNANLFVVSGQRALFLKQARGDGMAASAPLVRERRFVLDVVPQAPVEVRDVLPTVEFLDDDARVIAYRSAQGRASAIVDLLERRSLDGVRAAADEVGRTIARLHRHLSSLRPKVQESVPGVGQTPWTLAVHRPGPEVLCDISAAQHRLLALVQEQKNLLELLDREASAWTGETVIHGDLRWDNIVVGATADETPWVVDWELVDIGPAAWDLAGLFADLLSLWVSLIDARPGDGGHDLLQQSRIPLSDIQECLRSVWSGYRAEAGVRGDEANELLDRTARLVAARLVQAALENSENRATIPNRAVLMLQLGVNVARAPEEAATALLGIPYQLAA
jgi:Ser/Thr protein kinase RdoA (MazF antagonist)